MPFCLLPSSPLLLFFRQMQDFRSFFALSSILCKTSQASFSHGGSSSLKLQRAESRTMQHSSTERRWHQLSKLCCEGALSSHSSSHSASFFNPRKQQGLPASSCFVLIAELLAFMMLSICSRSQAFQNKIWLIFHLLCRAVAVCCVKF